MKNNLVLSFSAQSLDNQSLDPVEVNGHFLAKEKLIARQKFAKKISKVSLNGTEVFSEGSHTAFLYGDKFLLETPSDQLDNDGRVAPILCHGHVPDEPSESWADDVVNAIVGFAGRIGRTISDDKQEMAHRGVEAILEKQKKNRRRRKMVRRAVGVLIVLVVLGIIYEIVFRK